MARLTSLIRLRRHGVEEKQKLLADLYRHVERFEIRKKQFEAELIKERLALDIHAPPEMLAYFGRYSQIIKRDLTRIETEIRKLDARVRKAQDDIRDAFADLKRIEIVQQNRDTAEKKEQEARESADLDEIGIEGHRRNAGTH